MNVRLIGQATSGANIAFEIIIYSLQEAYDWRRAWARGSHPNIFIAFRYLFRVRNYITGFIPRVGQT